ncbi:MAG: class I SAM-dependent methyltransferase [Sandaracinaceae bacterium]|nr:MAG: class I SAM-dependent methyltransferase [Sandaracinaceae bacterium]
MILVVYTTHYREGGPSFERAARTLGDGLRREDPERAVRVERVESKRALRRVLADLAARGETFEALHIVAHAGMYGPMFGSTDWPEQLSPREWQTLEIPFAPGAEAYFHACRSARWFAPFFARTFGVPAHGYHWYTAFSAAPDRFVWPGLRGDDHPLYVFGCPGKKSHGLLASARKYAGLTAAEPMRRFAPEGDAAVGYDGVAEAYDAVFDDIRVRHDEVRWIESRLDALPPRPDVLDLGCGNGALLAQLAPRVASGVGLDASARMVERARARTTQLAHVSIAHVDGPSIPLPDASVDAAISMLSFRYLDWDPIVRELGRVLRPSGRLLVVDMVEKPASLWQLPRATWDRGRVLARALGTPSYQRRLRALVRSPEWARVLAHNPMRALHEYDWYLHSRFPAGQMWTLNVGRRARVIAFDTGPFREARLDALSYP